jgi:hypothetical protein
MRKKRKPIKVKWEWIAAPDAEARLRAAFDLILSGIESQAAEDSSSPDDDSDTESQKERGQLPLF